MSQDTVDDRDLIIRTVRAYRDDYLMPEIDRVEADDEVAEEVKSAIRKKAVELGIYGYNLPEAMGGPGFSFALQTAIASEMGRVPVALRRGLTLSETLGVVNETQRSWLLEPIVRGEKSVSNALTEPNGGSDLGNIKTRGEFDGNHWILNGEKQFISDFDESDFLIVLTITHPEARFRERFTAFIVEPHGPGFEYTPRLRLMSWRGVHLGGFRLSDYQVLDDHILGEPGRGFDAMIAAVNGSRLRHGASCTGLAAHVLDTIGDHVVTRKTFGQRLGDHQAILFMLADRDLEVDISRLLVNRAAYLGDNLGTDGITTNDFRLAMGKSKLYGIEMLGRVVDTAVQLFGAAGITRDLPAERWYRDARVYRISEGSTEMQRIQLGRAFLARYTDKT